MASNVRLGQARLFWCAPERKLKGAKTQVIGNSKKIIQTQRKITVSRHLAFRMWDTSVAFTRNLPLFWTWNWMKRYVEYQSKLYEYPNKNACVRIRIWHPSHDTLQTHICMNDPFNYHDWGLRNASTSMRMANAWFQPHLLNFEYQSHSFILPLAWLHFMGESSFLF